MRRWPRGSPPAPPGAAELTAVGERLARFHADAQRCVTPDGAEAVKRALDDNFASLRGLVRRAAERRALARAERFAAAFLTRAWDELDRRAARGQRARRPRRPAARARAARARRRGRRLRRVRRRPAPDRRGRGPRVPRDGAPRGGPPGSRRGAGARLPRRRRRPGQRRAAGLLRRVSRAGAREGRAHARGRSSRRARRRPARACHADDAAARSASGCSGPRATPLVVVVAGVSASGKTTLARALADESGFADVSSDVVRKRRAGLAPTDRAPRVACTARRRTARPTRRSDAAPPRRRARASIVDATFRNRADRDAFREQLPDGTPLLVVECRAPGDVLVARAHARARERARASDAGPTSCGEQLRDPRSARRARRARPRARARRPAGRRARRGDRRRARPAARRSVVRRSEICASIYGRTDARCGRSFWTMQRDARCRPCTRVLLVDRAGASRAALATLLSGLPGRGAGRRSRRAGRSSMPWSRDEPGPRRGGRSAAGRLPAITARA